MKHVSFSLKMIKQERKCPIGAKLFGIAPKQIKKERGEKKS